MPCTPGYCDVHDYRVAPGAGWCRAVDAAYDIGRTAPRSDSSDEGLAGAIERLSEVLEGMVDRQPRRDAVAPKAPPERRQPRRGGTPL